MDGEERRRAGRADGADLGHAPEAGWGADRALVDLGDAVRACRERDVTTEGVRTYLLLEDPAAPVPRGGGRPDAEGPALGRLAEEILSHLVGAMGRPSDRDVALALEVLAARRFSRDASTDTAPGATSSQPEAGGRSALAAAFAAGRYVRAVNFHATPRRLADRLEEQLSWLAERFAPVTDDGLLRLFAGGGWPYDRPGVIVSFYNGFRDNFEVAAPILDRVGLVGRFFVVSGWVSTPPSEQRAFAARHRIVLPEDRDLPADGRLALSPDEVAALAERGHVISSHTTTHAAPAPELPTGALERETAGSRRELESLVGGQPVRALAWHKGSPLGLDAQADAALRAAGYELLFANHAIQRVR